MLAPSFPEHNPGRPIFLALQPIGPAYDCLTQESSQAGTGLESALFLLVFSPHALLRSLRIVPLIRPSADSDGMWRGCWPSVASSPLRLCPFRGTLLAALALFNIIRAAMLYNVVISFLGCFDADHLGKWQKCISFCGESLPIE